MTARILHRYFAVCFFDKLRGLFNIFYNDTDALHSLVPQEVTVALSSPGFPGYDPDRFDHWKYDSDLNQELLNGAYWRVRHFFFQSSNVCA